MVGIISTIGITKNAKSVLETLRRKFPTSEIPTLKDTIVNIIYFVEENEDQFIEWIKNKKESGAEI